MSYKYQMLPLEKVFLDPVHNYIHVQNLVIQKKFNVCAESNNSVLLHIPVMEQNIAVFLIHWVFMILLAESVIFFNGITHKKNTEKTVGMTHIA